MDIQKLKAVFKGEISLDPATLKTYSKDASIFEIQPQAVARPENVADLETLVKWASEEKAADPTVSLTARAGGTDMTGGAINSGVIVDFTAKLNHVGEVVANTITCGPGAFWRDVETKISSAGLIMPAYPASKSICAVGGMVGNNCGGEMTLNHGQAKDWVGQLKMVFADGEERVVKPLTPEELTEKISQDDFEGEVYRKIATLIDSNKDLLAKAKPSTSKNSTGYQLWDVWHGGKFDLSRLITGSQGTLGLVTEVTWKLIPQKPHKQLLVVFTRDIARLSQLVQLIRSHRPETFELYDDHTLYLALRFVRDIAARLKKSPFRMFWEFLPEVYMALTGGLPKLVLLAEFAHDNEAGAKALAETAAKELTALPHVRTHLTRNQAESEKYWTVRRESFNLLRQHAHGKISSPFVEDFIVHPEQLGDFLPRLREIFSRYPRFEYTLAGHAGDGNFHIIPFVDLKVASEHEMVLRLSHEVYSLIKEFKGSISAEHNDGLAHGAFLYTMYSPEVLELFHEVKRIFDPKHIFNPGKKVEATEAAFMKYMRTS